MNFFEFPLAEEKVKKQQIIALHLIVSFAFIASGAVLLLFNYLQRFSIFTNAHLISFTPAAWQGLVILLLGIALLLFVILKSKRLLEKKTNRVLRLTELLLIAGLAIASLMGSMAVPAAIFGVVATAILFAIYWETVSDNTIYITFEEKGVRLPVTSRRRTIEWWEIQHVIFRFGVLTIDCYDNRLFQWNVRDISLDKEAFNRFCNTHIAANSEKHKKNNW